MADAGEVGNRKIPSRGRGRCVALQIIWPRTRPIIGAMRADEYQAEGAQPR